MNLNDNFNERVVVHGGTIDWVDSPIAGVRRRMLDRLGDEVARATTIVEYAPGSQFSPHVHTGGEEFVVLEGVFSDEHGDFPAGSYIRNPPQSRHTPGSAEGCVIFVKLWQFDLADRTHVRQQLDKMGRVEAAHRAGIAVTPLYQDARETVQVEYWSPGAQDSGQFVDGAEVLVLEGSITEHNDRLERWSWLRIPRGGVYSAQAGSQGATVWVKHGHLSEVNPPIQ